MNEVWVVVKEKSYSPECRQCPLVSQWWFLDGLHFCSSKEKAEEYVTTESSKLIRLEHWSEDALAHDFQYTTFQDVTDSDTTYKYTIEKRNTH